jgi:acyl carrier protein
MDHRQKLKDFIVGDLLDGTYSGPLADDQDLLISGLVDSLGVVRMINFIEQSMEVSVPPQDVTLENFQTVDKIVAYLDQRNPKQ